jgi:hypothetical protein
LWERAALRNVDNALSNRLRSRAVSPIQVFLIIGASSHCKIAILAIAIVFEDVEIIIPADIANTKLKVVSQFDYGARFQPGRNGTSCRPASTPPQLLPSLRR